jgi:Ran GTPase-activating protein (RanGAP) involved in mRNA processing and transport
LQSNKISEKKENLALLSTMIARNKSIKKLYLDRNFLGRWFQEFKLVCDALQSNKAIKFLSLNHNEIGDDLENSNFLSKLITKNKTLEVMHLAGNNLCDFDYEVLRKAFMKNNKLKEIDVTFNDFEEEFYNKLIDDNPAKKICLQPCHYQQNSSFTYSSGDNELVEHEEIGEDEDQDLDYYAEDPNFDDLSSEPF